MKYCFKAGLLFTLSLSLAPLAANAYPVSLQAPQRARTAAPIVKTDFDYGGGWHPRSGYWRPRYFIYEWRPRRNYGGWGGDYGHSRYYSHYRWGSYHRFCDPCERPRPCDGCGWDD
ncbi:MAG: hypothetical protein ACLPKH_19770 [Rhodomicrobium sp.]